MKVERKSRKRPARKVPKGFHTVTPFLMVNDARPLIEFMERALYGEVTSMMKSGHGKIMHATVEIGNSIIMVADVMSGADRCLRCYISMSTMWIRCIDRQ